ncbi:MAG: carbohydrate kinase family protein [Chloroflexi bacterium]|nr:carbohydrate kinase family protein [Chloroflexota bacterium]
MPTTIDAVVAGHICLDVFPDLSHGAKESIARIFTPGRLVEVGDVTFSAGGPVANTGLALNRLGINTLLMGKVGDDLYGNKICHLVAKADPQLADGMIVDSHLSTSYTIVINPPQIDRIFLHFPGANDTFGPDDVSYDLVARAKIFHFGYPPIMKSMYRNGGENLTETFRRAKTTGVTTSLDMSLPDASSESGQVDWKTILANTLPYVDLILPSVEEILFMLQRSRHQEMAKADDLLEQITPGLLSELSERLLDLGVRIVVIKLGHRGLYVRTGSETVLADMGRACPSDITAWANREIWAPAFRVVEVGAAGSGDAAISGFLAALLRDPSLEKAAIMATAVGAYNVEEIDSLSGIRTWQETQERIEAGWDKRKLEIQESGWGFDKTHQLWLK